MVKLQHGEYVALGKIESQLKTCPLVDNICVYADSTKNFVVALLMPNTNMLMNLMNIAEQSNICFPFAFIRRLKTFSFIYLLFFLTELCSLEEMCSNLVIENLALLEIQKHCATSRLEKFEVPQAIKLVPDIWTPDIDLVTAAFKLKRKNIQARINTFAYLNVLN